MELLIWNRGVGTNGPQGCYITYVMDTDAIIATGAGAMSHEDIAHAIELLAEAKYRITCRWNDFHDKHSWTIAKPGAEWEDDQSLVCVGDDPWKCLKQVIALFYVAFADGGDWRKSYVEFKGQSFAPDGSEINFKPDRVDEIPF